MEVIDEKSHQLTAESIDSLLLSCVPILALVLMYLVTIALEASVMVGTHLEAVATELTFGDIKGRLTWGVGVVFFALSIAATFALAIQVISHTFQSTRQQQNARALCWAAVIAAAVWAFIYPSDFFSFNDEYFGSTVYSSGNAEPFVSAVELLGNLALVILAVAASAVLVRLNHGKSEMLTLEPGSYAKLIARSQKRVRILLYVGAMSLIAGTLHASLLYSWSVSMVSVDGSKPAYLDTLPDSMGTITGSFYTVLLAAVFLPALLQLSSRANELAEAQHVLVADRAEWLKGNGLDKPFLSQLTSMLAVLAPLLAGGPVSSLVEMITR